MELVSKIDGKQIIWQTHMKSEPLKRRGELKETPRLKSKVNYPIHDIQVNEKKQIGIVKPLLTMKTNNNTDQWNCDELEKLQRRFSELLDGKIFDEQPINTNVLIERLQSIYSSMGSYVHVCPCLVRLFHITDLEVCSLEQWKYLFRGYPIWLHNTGLNPRRSSELRLLIVDEQSGFILWSDRITSRSNIIQPANLTLSFRHSSNQSSIMLRFETIDGKFFTQFFTDNHSKRKFSRRFIRKSDISPPCHFNHLNPNY